MVRQQQKTSSTRSAFLALAAVVMAGTVATGVASRPVGAAPPGAPRVTLLGDSTMAALEWSEDAEHHVTGELREAYDVSLQVASCRRLVDTSCRGRFGDRPESVLPLMRGRLSGTLGQTIVIMAGYDDLPGIRSDIDAIMAEATAQGVSQVMWLTFPEHIAYRLPGGMAAATIYTGHNAELRAATLDWPSLRLLDWQTMAATNRSWFSDDGIHLTFAGAQGLARFLHDSLDGSGPTTRCVETRARTGTPQTMPVGTAAPDSSGPTSTDTGFHGIAPVRVLDTRLADSGGRDGKVGAGRTVTVPLGDRVPIGSVAAALSVTAVEPCDTGYLTVFPCGPLTATSSVNYVAMRDTAGFVVSPLTDGAVCIHSSAATDVIVDVLGGFAPGGELFHPITPQRWIDTRRDGASVVASGSGTRRAGDQLVVPVAGVGGIGSDAAAVMLNLTSTESATGAVLSVSPTPCPREPTTSTVNVPAGRDGAATAIVDLGPDGSVCVTTYSGSGHLLVDVAGWFGPGGDGLAFRAMAPQRLADSRSTPGPLPGGRELAVAVGVASMVTITVTDARASAYASIGPCGATSTASIVNTRGDEAMANSTPVAPGSDSAVCAAPSTDAHVIVDRTGIFVPVGS